ncbi:MAG: DUF3168 domain-containing protein [Pseudomonadota bacterium]
MSSETVLYTTLKGNAGVTAYIGTGDSARIYPDVVPQTITGSSIAYQRVGTEPIATVHTSVPLGAFATIEVWCMTTRRIEAEALADAAQAALGGAQFALVDRRVEYDHDNELWAAVLTVRHFST